MSIEDTVKAVKRVSEAVLEHLDPEWHNQDSILKILDIHAQVALTKAVTKNAIYLSDAIDKLAEATKDGQHQIARKIEEIAVAPIMGFGSGFNSVHRFPEPVDHNDNLAALADAVADGFDSLADAVSGKKPDDTV